MADTPNALVVTGPQLREMPADQGAPEPMDEAQFGAAVKAAIDDGQDYIDSYIARSRAQATSMYRGDLFGNEEPGRSQFVMTEVRDTVLAQMPSLLRIFTSSSEVCTFEPRTAQKVEQAEQATDYVNYLFYNDNDGFTILYNAFKDALVRKSGVLKWRWDEDIEIAEYSYTDLSDAQMQQLTVDPDVEILEDIASEMPNWQPPVDPATGQPVPIPTPMLHDVRIRRHKMKKRVLVECLPVEELLVSRTGRELKTCPMVGHRSLKTYSDLVKMGYSLDQIKDVSGIGDTFLTNVEAQARNPAINAFQQSPDINDESATKVVYNEAFIRIDKDGDGIAELRRVCMIGHTVLADEVWDEVPMSVLCPDPEPHMIIGNSVADQTMDIQILMSAIVRNTLDSLAQAIHPRTAVVEGQVNMDDVMNTETGAIVRMRAPGMVQELNTTFVGQQAMPIIAWIDQVKAKRTGVVPASAGLDPDVLQSTTKSGVDATIQGAQERTEMIARLFAETGVKPMMKGILKLVCKHQDRARMVRLRGKWVEVDPRVWDADMDVITHVALGRGTDADRLQALALIATKQEGAIAGMGGVTNPLADLSNYRNTLGKMTEIMGYKNVDQFFKPVDMQAIAQQQAQNPPPPDPNLLVAQAQQAKVQAEIELNKAQHQLAMQRQQMEEQKAIADHQLKMRQAEVDAETQRQQNLLQDQRERDKARLDAIIKLQIAELQYGTAVRTSETELELERAGLLADVAKHREGLDRDEEAHVRDLEADMAKHRMTIEQKREAAAEAARAKKEAGNGNATE